MGNLTTLEQEGWTKPSKQESGAICLTLRVPVLNLAMPVLDLVLPSLTSDSHYLT